MTSPIRVLRQIVAPNGRHRAKAGLLASERSYPVRPGRRVLSENELLEGWPLPVFVPGAVVAQCFDDCPTCRKATAGALTKDGWRCGECLQPVPAGGAS